MLAFGGWIGTNGTSLAAEVAAQVPSASAERAVLKKERGVVQYVCTACHGEDEYNGLRNTRRGWQAVVDSMRQGQGAFMTDKQYAQILDYLTTELGVPLKINQATATDLAAAMGLPAGQAEALVAYREKHGPFKTIDDLLKVPGITPSRILEQRKNLSF
ncbi:MAG: helix-hairpin-helix domain-containing protein [Acetobacteraceae bacterium]